MPPNRKSLLATRAVRAAVVCVLVMLAGTAFGESPPFKSYTTEEGLGHDQVNEIVRDSRGFLWFCTAEGLSRFDGSRFTNFTQNEGLPHRNVNDILELQDGRYLIGTTAGLVTFDPLGRPYRWNITESRLEVDSIDPPMFRLFTLDTDNRQRKTVHSLAQMPDGTVWVGSGHGLYRIYEQNGEWTFEEQEVEEPKVQGFGDLLPDSKGGLIIVASGGLYRYVDGRLLKFADHGAASAMEDSTGRIWIGAGGHDDGIRIFSINEPLPALVETLSEKDGLPDDLFQYDIKQLADGRVFVGQWAGLSEYLPDAPQGEPKFRLLNTDSISTLETDSVGNLWYGTEFKGASKIVQTGFTIFGPADGLSESIDIRSIYFDSANNIYLPTRPIDIFHREGRKFVPLRPQGMQLRSWGWHFVDFEASDGKWWIAGYDGLRRYPKVSRFADLAHTPPEKIFTGKDGLHGTEIFMIFEDSRGDVWITAGQPNCLSRWDRASDTLISYTDADGLPLNNGTVSHAEDRLGNVWLGFFFGSIARYSNGKFERFTEEHGMPRSMPSELFADSHGRLWVGTSGLGLYRIDDPAAARPSLTSITTSNGLSSNQVICMTEDRFGRLYVGTGRGINRIDPDGKIKVFTQADGLPSNYIIRCAIDRTGNLWFVSGSTLVKFLPEVSRDVPPPPVYIDRISVNGVAQKISALGETDIRLPEFGSDQHQVQVSFYALTFGSDEDVAFQYRLDGQDWNPPSDLQTLSFDLSPGSHELSIRAMRSDGSPSEHLATARFDILPPIWARGWFITIAAVLVSATILFVFRYRTQNLRQINAALLEANRAEEALRKAQDDRVAELEQVRSRIATDLHDDIGSSLTQIAVLSEVAQAQAKDMNGHGDVLQKITNVSNDLVGTMSDIVWAINPAKDRLKDLTQRMRRVASDLLSPRGIVIHFRSHEEERAHTIKTNVRREVFLIFKESINNISKHSGARNVHVDLHIEGDLLTLKISDDGNGFICAPPSFEDTYSSEGPSGNGLRNMRKRAREIGGSFEIESAPGRGTTTVLSLPLDSVHVTEI